MNFLELVNRSIQEAGKDQDSLTSLNFTSPPDFSMYTRFKNWVNDSYMELQMARNEWEFKTARAAVFIYPAIYVEQGTRAGGAPSAGAVFVGDDTGFELTVVQVITHSGDWTMGTAKATIYFLGYEGTDYKFNEQFDEVSPVAGGNRFRAKGWGRYNFLADGQVPDLWRPLENTFAIQSTGGSALQENTDSLGLTPLPYVDWDYWQNSLNARVGGRSSPSFITRAPDGNYEVWPRANEAYVLTFSYNTSEQSLTQAIDAPSIIPERFHPLIMWMAMRKSGMYDRDRMIVAKAGENMKVYRNAMERDLMPDLSFGRSVYNYE